MSAPWPSPAIVLAALALIAAVAGTAVAADPLVTTTAKKVTKKTVKKIAKKQIGKRFPVAASDIAAGAVDSDKLADGAVTNPKLAPDAVDGSKIADGAVGAPELSLLELDHAAAEVVLPGSAGQASFPDDPSLSVNAEPGDVIYVHARVDIRRVTGTGRCNALLRLDAPGSALDTTLRFAASDSATFQTVFADPNQEDVVSGTTSGLQAEGRQLPVLVAGPYVFDFRYDQGNGTTDCAFRERALWVGVIR